jgi:hypothetical protein
MWQSSINKLLQAFTTVYLFFIFMSGGSHVKISPLYFKLPQQKKVKEVLPWNFNMDPTGLQFLSQKGQKPPWPLTSNRYREIKL